jgi:superfamily I DNA/RNA helicase
MDAGAIVMSSLAGKYSVAISSDFLTAFAAVPRQEQGKVVDFVTKFRNNGMMPLKRLLEESGDTGTRQEAETAERSLLYVAATRAKKTAVVTCHGKISRLLSPK